ncbi:hypothetical protein BTK96_004280 [Burkholderia pyrrocinia]|uniref:hypothetical protein n=1 Tax=Burkholderia sp. IT-111MI5 TaxID=3026439 RepID=UPI002A335BD7|nr:hypothetical protein [Burkholderia pyrrocinia]EKS9895961.1 hypothetical protein [Burkholderia pyrrocinia]EKS9909010.1 hypothetical protein [Burkholderia pyrrocinia]
MNFPTKEQFFESFGLEPVQEDPTLALCRYRVRSQHCDVQIDVSFSGVAESFEVRLECCGREVVVLVSERAELIELYREREGNGIRAVFMLQGVTSEAIVILEPEISCRWSVLRTE